MTGEQWEKHWATGSPDFTAGQQVYCYIDNTPAKIVGPNPDYPGYWFVTPDDGGHQLSVAWDNILTRTDP